MQSSEAPDIEEDEDAVWITDDEEPDDLRGPAREPTGPPRPITDEEVADLASEDPNHGVERPRTRADCAEGERPCPWTGCRHNLYLEVRETGLLKLVFPGLEVEDMGESCALDVADRGGHSQADVAPLLNLTRARLDQVEDVALRKMKHRMRDPRHDD